MGRIGVPGDRNRRCSLLSVCTCVSFFIGWVVLVVLNAEEAAERWVYGWKDRSRRDRCIPSTEAPGRVTIVFFLTRFHRAAASWAVGSGPCPVF